jgi:hypothetical protein
MVHDWLNPNEEIPFLAHEWFKNRTCDLVLANQTLVHIFLGLPGNIFLFDS